MRVVLPRYPAHARPNEKEGHPKVYVRWQVVLGEETSAVNAEDVLK